MNPTRKSTEKEILVAVLSICFAAYIITMVVLQSFFSMEYAERLNGFLLQWGSNIIFWGLSFCFFAGAFLYLIAMAKRL